MNNQFMNWNDLFLFAKVVEQRGFTAAGKVLDIPKSKLSRRISALEIELGTRLLQRNTRRLSLTDAGVELFEHCRLMLKEADEGILAVRSRSLRPMGNVRISMPIGISELFAHSLIPTFLKQFPDVQITILATNKSIDLIEDQIDIVIRGLGITSSIDDSNLIQACICTVPWHLVASPDFLINKPIIESIKDLSQIPLLQYVPNDDQESGIGLLDREGKIHDVAMPVAIKSDNLQVLLHAALSNLGVCGLPSYLCKGEINSGKLIELLPGYSPKLGQIRIMFPTKVGLSPAARSLIEFLKIELPQAIQRFT